MVFVIFYHSCKKPRQSLGIDEAAMVHLAHEHFAQWVADEDVETVVNMTATKTSSLLSPRIGFKA